VSNIVGVVDIDGVCLGVVGGDLGGSTLGVGVLDDVRVVRQVHGVVLGVVLLHFVIMVVDVRVNGRALLHVVAAGRVPLGCGFVRAKQGEQASAPVLLLIALSVGVCIGALLLVAFLVQFGPALFAALLDALLPELHGLLALGLGLLDHSEHALLTQLLGGVIRANVRVVYHMHDVHIGFAVVEVIVLLIAAFSLAFPPEAAGLFLLLVVVVCVCCLLVAQLLA